MLSADHLVRQLAGLAGIGADAPLAVAVSGGADSLALLRLAHAAFGARVHVLSVDHGLRASAADECAMVAGIAAGLGLRHATLHPAAPIAPANVQDGARRARYQAMAGWCVANGVPYLLTAHHADDQAETLLMRLARGSGPGGLSGIRAVVHLHGVQVLRPLLGTPRAALHMVLEGSGWVPVDDPSNADPRFDRTAARALLAATGWLQPERLAAAAANLCSANEALDWAAARAWASRAVPLDAGWRIDAAALPRALQHALLIRALAELGTPAPDGPAADRLLTRLLAGGGGTLGNARATAAKGDWLIRPAPPRAAVR